MPELSFQIEGVEVVDFAVAPTLAFKVRVTNAHKEEELHSILLRCQVQIEATRRRYSDAERAKLFDLFGQPQEWARTLHTMLWAQASLNVPAFSDSTVFDLFVPCTYDLNVAATKYFDAMEGGDVSLRFLFSGTAFYGTERDSLLVAQIPWDKEAAFRMPIQGWRDMMERHYPNSAWLYLRKDIFDRLHEYKRRSGYATWEQTVESLLETSSVSTAQRAAL